MFLNSIAIFAVIILASALAILISKLEKQRKEIEQLKAQRIDIEFQARQKALRLLEDAREKGIEIIMDATVKAGKDKSEIANDWNKITNEQLDIYKQMIQTISKSAEKESVRKLSDLNKAIDTEISTELKKVSEEMQIYKDQKIKDVNQKLREYVIDISRTLVGKSLTHEEHVDLVMKSLTESEQKYGF